MMRTCGLGFKVVMPCVLDCRGEFVRMGLKGEEGDEK